jgi:TatD DNase family protein
MKEGIMYIDTHCHLDFPDFDADREDVINNSIKENVVGIINISTGIESSKRSVELSEKYSIVHPVVGVHPANVNDLSLSDVKKIEEIALNKSVVGIGETGLDFHYGREYEEKQKDFFRLQIEIAVKLKMPLIIHQRDSRDEVLDVLEKTTLPEKVVFHCFGGDYLLAEYCKKKGLYISFTGIVTFKKKSDDVKRIAGEYPLNRIMAETDAPYLSPEPFRGRRNDPSMVRYIVETIAGIRGMKLEECAEQLLRNSKSFFSI